MQVITWMIMYLLCIPKPNEVIKQSANRQGEKHESKKNQKNVPFE